MEQLNGLDSLFVYSEQPTTPMTISMVSFYDPATAPRGEVNFQDIVERFATGMSRASIFRRRLVKVPGGLDRPYWVDDPDFDVALHVRQIALPTPGTWQQLYTLMGRLQADPLDLNRPLWEAYVIYGLNSLDGLPPGCFALFTKVHHAAIDGITGLKVFMDLHSLDPEEPASESACLPYLDCEPRPPASQLLWNTARNYGSMAMRAGRITSSNFKALLRVRDGLKNGLIHHAREKPLTRFNLDPSRDRTVGRFAMDRALCQRLRKLVPGATLNDLMLTVVSGGLRRYLQSVNELPASSLVAGCPVNIRNRDNRESDENLVGMMNVNLRTDIEDPLQRFQAIHDESRVAKEYHRRLGPQLLNQATELLPPFLLNLGVSSVLRLTKSPPGTHNTLISNIGGLKIPVYFSGAKLVDGFALGPVLPHCNLFHTVLGVNENISIGFNACRKALSNRDHYLACLGDSWRELQDHLPRQTAQVMPLQKQERAPRTRIPTGSQATKSHSSAGASNRTSQG